MEFFPHIKYLANQKPGPHSKQRDQQNAPILNIEELLVLEENAWQLDELFQLH